MYLLQLDERIKFLNLSLLFEIIVIIVKTNLIIFNTTNRKIHQKLDLQYGFFTMTRIKINVGLCVGFQGVGYYLVTSLIHDCIEFNTILFYSFFSIKIP